MQLRRVIVSGVLVVAGIARASAVDSLSHEQAAAKLTAATITVRVSLPVADGSESTDTAQPNTQEVTVCTGVAIGEDLLVTFNQQPANARFRVTLIDGEQAEAQAAVVDHYTGLRLLTVNGKKLTSVAVTENLPAVAAPVLTAAAAGLEKPAVSLGILSGVDRSLPGTELPLLLQCDVRTTETSAGAGIVDAQGRLIGIVAATAAPGERAGWTYAIPAQHILRLRKLIQPGQLIEVKRLRPVAGLTIGPGDKEGMVVVERVVPGGPAEKAGLKAGDQILETDNHKIRSAYQALDPIMKRQPGDKVSFLVQRGDERKELELTLGGANAVAAAARNTTGVLVGPQLTVKSTGKGVEVRNSNGVQELSTDTQRSRRSPGDEVDMLRTQLLGFEQVIRKLQTELQRRGELQQEADKTIQSMQAEIDQLRKKLDNEQK